MIRKILIPRYRRFALVEIVGSYHFDQLCRIWIELKQGMKEESCFAFVERFRRWRIIGHVFRILDVLGDLKGRENVIKLCFTNDISWCIQNESFDD